VTLCCSAFGQAVSFFNEGEGRTMATNLLDNAANFSSSALWQGDLIGRNFAYRVIVDSGPFGKFFKYIVRIFP
jgi:hypothetical protein